MAPADRQQPRISRHVGQSTHRTPQRTKPGRELVEPREGGGGWMSSSLTYCLVCLPSALALSGFTEDANPFFHTPNFLRTSVKQSFKLQVEPEVVSGRYEKRPADAFKVRCLFSAAPGVIPQREGGGVFRLLRRWSFMCEMPSQGGGVIMRR